MELHDWNAIPIEKMNALVTRQAIHTDRMTIARLHLAKGAVVPVHRHENEQVSTIESGSLDFEVAGEKIVLRAGQSLQIPSNVPHGVVANEDCVAVDVFTPRREDWISGDDAYLRK